MTIPAGDPDPDGDLSAVDLAFAQEVREVAEDHPGWAVTHDMQGYWARHGDDVAGPVSCPLALRSMLGLPKPRKAAP